MKYDDVYGVELECCRCFTQLCQYISHCKICYLDPYVQYTLLNNVQDADEIVNSTCNAVDVLALYTYLTSTNVQDADE